MSGGELNQMVHECHKLRSLARELYEAAHGYADEDPTSPALQERWQRLLAALARYEREAGQYDSDEGEWVDGPSNP